MVIKHTHGTQRGIPCHMIFRSLVKPIVWDLFVLKEDVVVFTSNILNNSSTHSPTARIAPGPSRSAHFLITSYGRDADDGQSREHLFHVEFLFSVS